MADNEKLLEAARMIQEHCRNVEPGAACCFANGGICDGVICNCGICVSDLPPSDWEFPKPCRWTERDVVLAKALQAFGIKKITKDENLHGVKFDCDAIYPDYHMLPLEAFKSMKYGETVQISDIIAEGENK